MNLHVGIDSGRDMLNLAALVLQIYHAIPLSGWQFFDTSRNLYWLFFVIANTTLYWLTIIVIVAMSALPIVCYIYYKEHYYPGPSQLDPRLLHLVLALQSIHAALEVMSWRFRAHLFTTIFPCVYSGQQTHPFAAPCRYR